MKAAWIRNFWTKTVAFLLAAALVPVILTYVVGLVYSYGGMGRDFYTSNLCLNAVGKKTWEICDDYIAMEGGNYELDKIYSKGDSYSNIRFRVTDEQDKVEFRNCSFATEEILYDPQTSGGLLASVDKEDVPAIMEELEKLGLPCGVVGEILPKQEKAVIIQ